MKTSTSQSDTFLFRNQYLICGGIIAFGLLLSYWMSAGPSPLYDDSFYVTFAHYAMEGNATFLYNRFTFGFLKILILAVSFETLGYGNFQAVLPNLLGYVLLIFFTFLIGKKLKDARLGLIASFLCASAPFAVGNAFRVLPDILLGLTLAAMIYVFLVSVEKKSRGFAFLFGALTVLPIYINEQGFVSALFFWLYVLFLFAAGRRNRRRNSEEAQINHSYLAWSLFGAVLAFSSYLLVFGIFAGNPFFVFQSYSMDSSGISPISEIGILLSPIIGPPKLMDLYPIGILSLLAIIGTVIIIARADKYENSIVFLNWSVLLFLVFGTTSTRAYLPIPIVTRFINMILAPLAILGAYPLLILYDRSKRNSMKLAGIIVLMALFSFVLWLNSPEYFTLHTSNLVIRNTSRAFYDAMGSVVNSLPNKANATVYTIAPQGLGVGVTLFLDFASKFDDRLTFYNINSTSKDSSTVPGSESFLIVAYVGNETSNVQTGKDINTWLNGKYSTELLGSFATRLDNGYTYNSYLLINSN